MFVDVPMFIEEGEAVSRSRAKPSSLKSDSDRRCFVSALFFDPLLVALRHQEGDMVRENVLA